MRSLPLLSTTPTATGTGGRSSWHRRVGLIPLGYLAAIVVVGFVHPFFPHWRWLLIHLLLLGAATNAIVVWSAHFAKALLRSPVTTSHRGEAARLLVLNVGIAGVLTAVVDGPVWQWVAVSGAALVFAAVLTHLIALATRLGRALQAPFAVTVHFYLAATAALLVGIPAGAWMLIAGADSRLLLFHAHVNVLGWVTLTVLGTLLTLWPAVLRTRMAGGAVRAAKTALPLAVGGLGVLGVGLLAWWRVVAVAGLALLAAAVVVIAVSAARTAVQRPPSTFAAWSVASAIGWLLVALAIDAATLLTAADPASAATMFGRVLVPLLAGFTAQVLVGSLAYLLPVVLGGGPALVRVRSALLDRHWSQRVVMANAALAVFMLPTGPYVRITTSLLVLTALIQFLVAAVRALLVRAVPTDRRS